MANINSPRKAFAVNLPSDLIEELKVVANYRQVSLDDVVMEACLAYTEPYLWEKAHQEWRQEHPDLHTLPCENGRSEVGDHRSS
jgi:hypothetical protein